jgi:hypothetical protein
MNHKVILTEKQLDRIVRNLMEEPIIPLSRQTDINAQNVNTASWERKKGRNIPMQLSANGKENFKLGEAEINTSAPQIKKIVSDLQSFNNQGGGTAKINGSASNTSWGNFSAGSSQAKEKNTQLAQKRRDNLIKYLKSLGLNNIKFVTGKASVADSDRAENQNITIDISGQGSMFIDPKGDIGDNTRTSPKLFDKKHFDGGIIPEPTPIYDRRKSRVCAQIPEKYVKELKKMIYDWGKTKGLKIPMSDKIMK